MATATSSRDARRARRATWPAAAALVVILVAVAAAAVHRSPAKPAPAPAAFSWLKPAGAPAGWNVAATPSGATLAFPPSWQKIATDRGTVSAAPRGPRGAFRGYLNATPQSGSETLANWSRFRVGHVAAEGGRKVALAAAATGLRFRTGRGSCVIDSYSTVATRFREVACIVAGPHATTVIVGTAPVGRWAAEAPLLERAVASFAT